MSNNVSAVNRSYNDERYTRESHNCYSYFLNLKDSSATELCKKTFNDRNLCRRSQPGYASGYRSLQTKDFNCPTIVERTLADNPNIKRINKIQNCSPESYKGAIVVAPGTDYHYYRLNKEGYWTHKPGYKPSTELDASGKLITDPETANRNYGRLNYSDFCGFVCVPKDPHRKQMRMYNNTNNNNPMTRVRGKLRRVVTKIIKQKGGKAGSKTKKLNVKNTKNI